MRRTALSLLSTALVLFLAAASAKAQSFQMDLPLQSQAATVSQRIGLTTVTITYHRPLAGSRKIWGGVVPYGQVWRAGANENTTIDFTDPVTIEGQALPKGTYGLHMIPTADSWTVIFSRNYTSWGSFTYDQNEDALRVTVKPQPSDLHDALGYDFDNLQPESAVVTMRWEKLAVPFKVAVNVKEITTQNLRNQMRSLSQYTWDGPNDAAAYLLDNKLDANLALSWADRAIQNEERFETLQTKSRALEAVGRASEAQAIMARALENANALQTHLYARQLQNQGKQKEAFELFRKNARKNPDPWYVHVGLARAYSGEGNYEAAMKEVRAAMAVAPQGAKAQLEGFAKRLEAKDDINK